MPTDVIGRRRVARLSLLGVLADLVGARGCSLALGALALHGLLYTFVLGPA
jgi:hypothetical protein